MKKSLWFVFVLLVTIASVDVIIFDWWLPQRFETQLAKGLRGGKLSFDDIELKTLKNIDESNILAKEIIEYFK